MNRFNIIFLSGFIAFFLVGCGGLSPKPATASSMPSWYLSELPKDSVYFYGVGEGSTKDSAKTQALSQISGQISITVASDIEMTEQESTKDGYSQSTKSNIKASTDSIKFTGVSIIETKYIGEKFYTYLKVDRQTLFQSLKRDLDNSYKKALSSLNTIKSQGVFSLLVNAKNTQNLVDNILSKSTIEILKSINANFDSSAYREKVLDISKNLESEKSQAMISLRSRNKLSSYYKDILAKYISNSGLIMVDSINEVADKSKLVIIDVSVKAKKKNVKTSDPRLRGASFAGVTVILTSKNSSGKIVAQNRINLTNISKDGLESAKIKTQKFERKIKKEGVLNILVKRAR